MQTTDSAAKLARESAAKGLGWGAFFCGFIPGLLQFKAGHKGRAIAAFASCTVLFFVGWVMVRDRLFHFAIAPPENLPRQFSLWATLAQFGVPTTLPEIFNLPANAIGTLLCFSDTNEAMRLWRVPRPMEHIGGFLTAASGLLATFWSADGHWLLRWQRDSRSQTPAPVRNPAVCCGVSWLLPGLGHALAGQRGKGMLMGAAVLIVYALGLLFGEGHSVDRSSAEVWWIGQVLCGGGTLFASLVTAPMQITAPAGDAGPLYLDLGVILCTVAGLMNLIVMVDAFTVAERSSFPLKGQAVTR